MEEILLHVIMYFPFHQGNRIDCTTAIDVVDVANHVLSSLLLFSKIAFFCMINVLFCSRYE